MRRASGISTSHSSQRRRLGPCGSWLRTRLIASLTVASIWSWTAPSPAQPVAMSDSWVVDPCDGLHDLEARSEEQTSELQSLMRNSSAVFYSKKKKLTTSPS